MERGCKDKLEMIEDIKGLSMLIVAYMKKNCSPHDIVIITGEQIKIVSEEAAWPIMECEASDLVKTETR